MARSHYRPYTPNPHNLRRFLRRPETRLTAWVKRIFVGPRLSTGAIPIRCNTVSCINCFIRSSQETRWLPMRAPERARHRDVPHHKSAGPPIWCATNRHGRRFGHRSEASVPEGRGAGCTESTDPNAVRARAMDGPQPINHRHADCQSRAEAPQVTCFNSLPWHQESLTRKCV